MTCDINKNTVKNGIVNSVRRSMIFSDMFTYNDDMFTIKDESSDYQQVVDDINTSFSEELVLRMGMQPIFAIVEPSEHLVNKYLSSSDAVEELASASDDELLSPEQNAEFRRLQSLGFISQNTNTVKGKTYFKIPGDKSYDKMMRLKTIIREKGLDFITILESDNSYLIQLGKVETHPVTTESTISSKASAITKAKVLQFLRKIGFNNIQYVSKLVYQGKEVSGEAYIDFLNGVMQIREGADSYSLPEEGMSILVELLKQSKPELYAEMVKEIVNYKMYSTVLNSPFYKSDFYKTEEGNPNYAKIKDEAISKLLSEYLINRLEGTEESAARIQRVDGWARSIINWVKEFFGLYKNPFKEALDKMNEDNMSFSDIVSDDIFFSAETLEKIDKDHPDNKSVWEKLKNRPSELNIHKEGSKYYKDNVEIAEENRVSALVDSYYTKKFGARNFDDALEEFYEQSRQDGDYLHEIFEEVIKSKIDPLTGLLKNKPSELTFPLSGNPIQGEIVKKSMAFIDGLMRSYPKGTRFLAEQIIYDEKENRFGTVDFMAILPDGKVDILDWKSVLLQDLQGVKDYKKGAIFVQLNEYARILKEDYSIESIGKLRAIPIHKKYKTDDKTKIRRLQSVDIGNSDPAKITDDLKRLRPVISPEESTGSEIKDDIVQKLSALYQKYIDKGYFKTDRVILDEIDNAIYEIRIKQSVDNLGGYFVDLTTKFKQLLEEGTKLKDGSKEDISEVLSMIAFYRDIMENVVSPAYNLMHDPTIDKDSRARLQVGSGQLGYLATRLDALEGSLLDALAKKNGIFDLLSPEKVVNLGKRWFRSMGGQDIASVRYVYELAKKAYAHIDFSTDNDLKTLQELKYNFSQWAKANNVSEKDAIGKLVNYEKHALYSKISRDFYDARTEAIDSRDGKKIVDFIKKNYDLKEYIEWYDKALAENKAIWGRAEYDSDPVKNSQIIRNKILTFEKNYNVLSNPITAFGYHNSRVWSKNIKEENWHSNEYKTLLLPENKALLDMYDFMVSKNKLLVEAGAIKEYESYTFLPNVRKTFADVLSFETSGTLEKMKDSLANAYNNWKSSLTIEDYELNYQGARDPFTGKKLEKRFIPFVSNVGSEYQIKLDVARTLDLKILKDNKKPEFRDLVKAIDEYKAQSLENAKRVNDETINAGKVSNDIFAIYGLMTKQINKELYNKKNDEIIRSLVHMEKNKATLEQNKFGKLAKTESGKLKISAEKGKNAPILIEHAKALVEGETLQTEADFVVQFRLKEKWNDSKLGKLYRFDIDKQYNPTGISTMKFIMWLSNANQKRILGVNLASAISNLFGGTYASHRLYSKYATEQDLYQASLKMTSGAFYATDEMKKNAALVDYFLPLLNNRESFKASQLSVNESAKILSQEWLMAPMRKTSEIVQLNIFLAVIENTGVVDGKIVNLRDKAAKELKYYDRYNLPETDRKSLEKELENKLKEYKEKYGLTKVSQFKTVKQAGKDVVVLDIPGVKRDSEDVFELRDIVQTMSKDALGEADEFDIPNYKYSMWWRMFMTFKNWIPRQMDVRFGEFRYSQAHEAHEYGRFRMFAKALTASYVQTVAKLIPLPYVTGKATNAFFSKDAMIKRAKEVYQEKIKESKEIGKYNAETFITEGEFVDKYIKGVDETFAEMRTLILMSSLLFMGIAAPDDDDNSEDKAWKALVRKQLDKLSDEVGFFYSPKSFIDIAGGGVPMLGLIRDSWYLGTNITEQAFGFTFEQLGADEKGVKMQESAKPVKRLFKIVPVLKEILTYLPAVDEETAKEWGVKVNDRRGF